MNRLFLIIFIFIISTQGYANECKEFDLREKDQSMEGIKISLQDVNTGTCYANTISMANDAWEKSNGFANSEELLLTSYLALASEYGMSLERKFMRGKDKDQMFYFESGGAEALLNLMKMKKDYCSVKGGVPLLEQLTDETLIKDMMALGQIYALYANAFGKKDVEKTIFNDEGYQKIKENLNEENKEKLGDFISKLSNEPIKTDGHKFVHRMIVETCDKVKKLKWHKFSSFSFEDIIEATHRTELKKSFIDFFSQKSNPQPIIIGYCQSALMKNSKSLDELINTKVIKEYGDPDFDLGAYCGPHASLIVGRKEHDGECKFIVRDNHPCETEHATKMNALCDDTEYLIEEKKLTSYLMNIQVITE